MRKSVTPLILALAALLTTLAFGVSPAAAKTPCWKQLLNDEFDGRIDNTYPVHCYHDALNHLQPDVKTYGDAYRTISRALASALLSYRGNHNGAGPPSANTPLTPKGSVKAKKHRNLFQWLADRIGPGNATSIPLPLLILAGLGLLLIAAAGASYAARRIQARRPRPQPATAPPAPRRD
jgi:hypothetical protein